MKHNNAGHPSPDAQEAFQFLLATAMHEAGKVELLNVAEVDDQTHYVFKSTAGEVFSVVRPEMSNVITWIVANALHTTATYVGFQYGASIRLSVEVALWLSARRDLCGGCWLTGSPTAMTAMTQE